MQDFEKYIEGNKKLWNKRTPIHIRSDFYDLEAFKSGKNSLMPTELEELGDISGKEILHLQCHFGQDSLSLQRLGGKVTAVDLSDVAIEEAKKLGKGLNLDTTFINSDIYKVREKLDKKFDIVFTSYGVIGWLPDLKKWAELIHHFLKSGGMFYIVEFHPFLWMYDEKRQNIIYSYFFEEDPIEEFVETGYADKNAKINCMEYGWNHHFGEIFSVLLDAGLQIEMMHEFPYSHYNVFPDMKEVGDFQYVLPDHQGKIPYMFSIKARKV